MRRGTTFSPRIPMGMSDLCTRGSFTTFRNKFRGPDDKIHYTYGVRQASKILKTFDSYSEALDYQALKAEKEA